MKTKRHGKKNRTTPSNIPYTTGRNVFGEKAETHLVILKRETAFDQMMDCICQLDGSTKEFTFDMRCFNGHEEELNQIMAKIHTFFALKADFSHTPIFDCSDMIA